MDKTAMVNLDVTKGSQIVDALEGAKLKMGVAFWVVLAEYQDWRLIISARQLDALDFRAAYRLVYDALAPGFRPEIPADHDPSDDRSLY